MGIIYFNGYGGHLDKKKAIRYMTKAANKEYEEAYTALGVMKELVAKNSEDYKEAYYWLNKSYKINADERVKKIIDEICEKRADVCK